MTEEKNKGMISEDDFRYHILMQMDRLNKSVAALAKSLEKIANPVMKLDPDDPNTVKNSSQAVRRNRAIKKPKRVPLNC